jgi:hypothetical protein
MVKESTPLSVVKPPIKESDEQIVMQKGEVIDILKTLEGLKRKLQPLLK